MSTDTSERLYSLLQEAAELRYGAAGDPEGVLSIPAYEDGPAAFVRVLVRARRRSDRIEHLLHTAKRVQHRLLMDARDAENTASDKLDEALAEGAKVRSEYSLGVERKAEANLKSFEEKRAARLAARQLEVANSVVDGLKDIHFGLNGWRTDVRDIVRSFQLESNLERS